MKSTLVLSEVLIDSPSHRLKPPRHSGRTDRIGSFSASLEKGDRNLGWTIARVPFDPAAEWPEMIRLRVRGTINGFAFRTSLFPSAGTPDSYYLLVNRAMQQASGAKLGHMAEFTLEPDLEPRPADLPEELDALLDEAEGLRTWYDSLSEYTRREIGKWVNVVKGGEARLRRSEQMAERLLSTMEAEAELPPLIMRAMQQRPRARDGWQRMTEAQRRNELLAVFYYRTPESQQKRVGKLCDTAERRA